MISYKCLETVARPFLKFTCIFCFASVASGFRFNKLDNRFSDSFEHSLLMVMSTKCEQFLLHHAFPAAMKIIDDDHMVDFSAFITKRPCIFNSQAIARNVMAYR